MGARLRGRLGVRGAAGRRRTGARKPEVHRMTEVQWCMAWTSMEPAGGVMNRLGTRIAGVYASMARTQGGPGRATRDLRFKLGHRSTVTELLRKRCVVSFQGLRRPKLSSHPTVGPVSGTLKAGPGDPARTVFAVGVRLAFGLGWSPSRDSVVRAGTDSRARLP